MLEKNETSYNFIIINSDRLEKFLKKSLLISANGSSDFVGAANFE
ncbi:MAG: hypothetical protein ABI891_08165 [Acidobacteriota bacterium]